MTGRHSGLGRHRPSQGHVPPSRFTPPHLAEKILNSRAALEGENKFVTVLFADISGSTGIIADLDAEDAMDRLDPAVAAMMDAIHRFEGTVNRIQGDGIMALFGAPIAHEDHALRACYAALSIQDRVAALGDPEIAVRVGLHSGHVVVRSISTDLSMSYDAVGPTVHLAARMEQLAEPGKIRITEDTYRLVKGHIHANPLGEIEVRGLSQLVKVYELPESPVIRTRWQARMSRGLTAFVGRTREVDVLCQALEDVELGHGRVVAIVGEAGVGKSRLVHEFLSRIEVRNVSVVEAAASPESAQVAYFPISNLLRRWLRVDDRDTGKDIAKKAKDQLAAIGEELHPFLSAYLDLIDVDVEDELWRQLEPAERRARIQRAIKALALQGASRRPLVIVLEDLQWLDAESRNVLNDLANSLGAASLMLVVTYRPHCEETWQSTEYFDRIRLGPLDARETERFLDLLLGKSADLPELRRLLGDRTEGTPLFIEELISDLLESGALVRSNGDLKLARSLAQIRMPPTVQAVIAARIDRLDVEAKELLLTASLLGKSMPASLLGAVAGLDEHTLAERAAELQRHGHLFETRIVPEVEFAFRHDLTWEVAQQSIPRERQRAIHRDIVAAINERYSNRLDEHVERLAHHAERAQMWGAALQYAHRAGIKALERSAYRAAVGYLDQALLALEKLPDDRERLEMGIDIRLSLRAALGAMGQIERMHERLSEALKLAERIEDKARLAAIKVSQTFAFNFMGRLDAAIEAGLQALDLAKETGDPALQIAGGYHLAQAYLWTGQAARARDLLAPQSERLRTQLRGKRIGTAGTTSVLWLGMLGAARAYLGEFDSGMDCIDEACAIADEFERPYDQIIANWYKGFALSHRGRHEEAIPALQRAYAICTQAQIVFLGPVVATSLGYAYLHVGRLADARPILENAVAAANTLGFPYARAWSSCYLGFARQQSGDLRGAADLARSALDLAAKHGCRSIHATASRLLAEVMIEQVPQSSEQAEQIFMQALQSADTLGLRPEAARCHVALARLYEARGSTAQVREQLAAAEALFRELGIDNRRIEATLRH